MTFSVIAVFLAAQASPAPPPQKEVDAAIRRGADFLIDRVKAGLPSPDEAVGSHMGYDYAPLVLYTLVHSGVDLQHPTMDRLIESATKATLTRTYQVSATAMALAAIDPAKYRERLALCGQWLVDWQADNGQWSYGNSYDVPQPKVPAATGGGNRAGTIKFPIKRSKKMGPAVGDNSNSQYAALGLRACSLAGCEFEGGTIDRAIVWWEGAQQKDGGWSYNYDGKYQPELGTYGSMTAGGASSLILLRKLRGDDPKSDAVTRGTAWLAANWAVDKNAHTPKDREAWHHYYLYALERVGDLLPTEKIGKWSWYAEGALYLIKTQQKDGTWRGTNPELAVADTCFALLFLERAARRAPVASAPGPDK